MVRTRKTKHWHPNRYEKVLLGITIVVAIFCLAILTVPAVASLKTERLPEDIPLLRAFPLQP